MNSGNSTGDLCVCVQNSTFFVRLYLTRMTQQIFFFFSLTFLSRQFEFQAKDTKLFGNLIFFFFFYELNLSVVIFLFYFNYITGGIARP